MKPQVSVQGTALPEAVSAALIRAGQGPLFGMDALVFSQGCRVRKGFLAALIRTAEGFFSGVGAYVSCQVTGSCEVFSTVGMRAAAEPGCCMLASAL